MVSSIWVIWWYCSHTEKSGRFDVDVVLKSLFMYKLNSNWIDAKSNITHSLNINIKDVNMQVNEDYTAYQIPLKCCMPSC
jgi:hypothetical protein